MDQGKEIAAGNNAKYESLRKIRHITLCISNSGFRAILKYKAINQRSLLFDNSVG
jgi:hypothetical protein